LFFIEHDKKEDFGVCLLEKILLEFIIKNWPYQATTQKF